MKLSVITINRNNAIGLKKTIGSVLNQTFIDFEYIIIDGASDDDSISLIKSVELQNFKWISEPDAGIFQAMNKGIKIAFGQYLLFLNSGDFLVDKNVLTSVFTLDYTEDILYGSCRITDNGKEVHVTNPPQLLTFKSFYETTIAHQAAFIKKSLFNEYGYYREDFKFMSDWEFWIRTLILNSSSSKRLNFIISDYNLEGISSRKNNVVEMKSEMEIIYNHPIIKNFLPDYKNWKREEDNNLALYWVRNNKALYRFVVILYKFAIFYNTKLKRK